MMLDSAEVVIIGAGVSGLSSGWWLAQAGVNVIVVEKGIVGYEASSRNGGQMGHRGMERVDGLAKVEVELWPQLDDMLGYPTEWKPGMLIVAQREDEMQRMNNTVRQRESLGIGSVMVDRQTVKE